MNSMVKMIISLVLWTVGIMSLSTGLQELIPEWHGMNAVIAGIVIIIGATWLGFKSQ